MEAENMIKIYQSRKKPFVAVLTSARPGYTDLTNEGWKNYLSIRSKFIESGLPVFDTFREAAEAVSRYIHYWQSRD
jgi:hypothetical protein